MNEHLKIEYAKEDDFNLIKEKVTSFFNLPEGHFEKYVPVLYKKDINTYKNHIIAKINNEIVGVFAFVRRLISINNNTYNMTVVGSICVDPRYRKQGIMTKMWDFFFKEFDSTTDCYVLSGDYSRYINYGFHPQDSLKMYFIETSDKDSNFTFIPATANDELALIEIYNNKESKVDRNYGMYDALCMWGIVPYIIKKDGMTIGYLAFDHRFKVIEEIVISGDTLLNEISESFATFINENVYFKISILNKEQEKFFLKDYKYELYQERTLYKIINQKIKKIYYPRNDLI